MSKSQDQNMPDAPAQTQVSDATPTSTSQEQRVSPDNADALEAKEVALLADIDAFDLEAAEKRAREEAQRPPPATGLITDTNLVFPSIVTEDGADGEYTPTRFWAGTSDEGTKRPPFSSSNLLGKLHQQAAHLTSQKDRERQRLSRIEAKMGEALYRAFSYLHELVQQLDVIKPVIPRNYLVTEDYELTNLAWQQGFSDYRTLLKSSGNTVDSVSFGYRLAGDTPLVIEREGSVASVLRQRLFDFSLKVKVEEFRSKSHYLERVRFVVAPEVQVNLRWEKDLQNGTLIISASNLERLGFTRYVLPPEKLTPAALDEFGRLVLGQPHRFLRT